MGEHTMIGTKIKVRSRITCFNFQAEVGEWSKIKRFRVHNGKFYKLPFSSLRIETGVPFSPTEYGGYKIFAISNPKTTRI